MLKFAIKFTETLSWSPLGNCLIFERKKECYSCDNLLILVVVDQQKTLKSIYEEQKV